MPSSMSVSSKTRAALRPSFRIGRFIHELDEKNPAGCARARRLRIDRRGRRARAVADRGARLDRRDLVGGRGARVDGGALDAREGRLDAETSDGIVYFASPMGRPATPFRLVQGGEKRAVFENKGHDFPQRILYWLTPDDTLHARIEGPRGGKTVSQEWAWKRTAR